MKYFSYGKSAPVFREGVQKKQINFICILIITLVVVPIYFYSQIGDYKFDYLSGFFLLIITLCSFLLASLGAGGRPKPISTTFYAFCYIFLGITPLFQVGVRQYPWGGQYLDGEIFLCALAIISGLIGFAIGAHFSGIFNNSLIARWRASQTLDVRKVFRLSLLFIPIVLFSILYLGGLDRLFSPRLLQADLVESTSVLSVLANNGMYVPCISFLLIFLATCLSSSRGDKDYWWSRLGVGFWLLIVLIIANPIGAPRYIFGAVIVAVLYFNTLRRLWVWPVFLIFAMLFLFPLADIFRNSLIVPTDEMPSAAEQLVYKADFDAFQQVANSIVYVDDKGYALGLQTLGSILFFVPRDLWPAKPLPTGMLVGEATGYTMLNLSMPLWGELYIDGGLCLITLGFFIYGVAVGVIERYAILASFHGIPGAFCIFFGAYQMYFLRGSLMVVLAYFVPFIIIFLFVLRRCRKVL